MSLKNVMLVTATACSINAFGASNILIDGKKIKNVDDLQRQFTSVYPQGKSLDAVYETLLSDLKSESIVRIKNMSILRKKLGDQYVNDFVEVVDLAAEDNPHVVLILQ